MFIPEPGQGKTLFFSLKGKSREKAWKRRSQIHEIGGEGQKKGGGEEDEDKGKPDY